MRKASQRSRWGTGPTADVGPREARKPLSWRKRREIKMRTPLGIAWVILGGIVMSMSVNADWRPAPEMFPWANPGAVRWAINYRAMNEAHVQALLDAHFNLIQGGSFKGEAMRMATEAGCHRMAYICSRTIYHEQLFPEHPELRDAAILTPEGDYKVIYNNPARYAGCYNRPAWLAYIKSRMDVLAETGLDCIFFDNPMTWECHCPTCQRLFREYSKEKTGLEQELGAEGTSKELERWFTLDTALKFFTELREYAHQRDKPMFIVANNLTYWLVDKAVTDGVFSEAGGQAPFGRDIATYKIGLAASHGKPTGILTYIPTAVKMVRGEKKYSGPSARERWYGAPVAEECEAGCAMGLALGGNYLSNFSLGMERHILDFTSPEDKRMLAAYAKYAEFAEHWAKLYAGQQPGSRIGVLFDLTEGPRLGDILGTRTRPTNSLLWYLQSQGVPADVIVNSDLTNDGIDAFGAIVIAGAAMLSTAEMRSLRAFVESGGTLVLAGAISIRDRCEPAAAGRSLAEFLPGCVDTEAVVQEFAALDLELEGYELETGRIKCPQAGTATLTFGGPAGRWNISVQYLDESDGQSEFELLVNGEAVQSWTADADDDAWHTISCKAVALEANDKVAIRARHGEGEYARLRAVTLRAVPPEGSVFERPLGQGKVIQLAGLVEAALPEQQAVAIKALAACLPVRGHWPDTALVNLLWQPEPGVLGVHIVNLDYQYGADYVLEAITPTPELKLKVQDAELRVARLISPEGEAQALAISEGMVTVPPVKNYAVVLLAADVEKLGGLGG